MRKPDIIIVQGYQDIFDEEPPTDRMSFIRNLSFQHILVEIVALNYRLKPAQTIFIDHTWETQEKELAHFTYRKENFNYVLSKCSKYLKTKEKQPNFFSRQSCVFAIEEILNSQDMKTIPDFVMNREDVWYNIFKYLLCVNSTLSNLNNETDEGRCFESLNPKLIPLNELSIESDPLLTPLRGFMLFKYLLKNETYSPHLKEYLFKTYGVTPEKYFLFILGYSISKNYANNELNFFFQFNKETAPDKFILGMSKRWYSGVTYKLLNIRKSPFIECWDNGYVLADNIFLLEKSYYQFLNDFWFDYLKKLKSAKSKPLFDIASYKSTFGYFFENYCDELLRKMLFDYKYSVLKTLNELIIPQKSGEKEIADFYFRYGKRIIVGQIKSGTIYDKEKYGADLESLYKNDREGFFENFGVNQIVKSIQEIEKNALSIDSKYPVEKNRIIFPILLFNDKLFQTPLMPDVFNKRFQELVENITFKKLTIKPLSIMHISDLEQLQFSINKTPKRIWEVLNSNCSDPKYMIPFYDSLNKLGIRGRYTDELVEEIRKAIEE
jgi:hypothetical protein